MFETSVGPIVDDSSVAYLRPETAQQIYINFKNVIDSTSRSLPFGIAQIGKSFRNEITPRNFIFRVREFEQMELEFLLLLVKMINGIKYGSMRESNGGLIRDYQKKNSNFSL